jgi:hypothetical protein
MDVFALRDQLVADYRHYAESFFTIRDERIGAFVEDQLASGLLWPDPMLQLNPAFECCMRSASGSSGQARRRRRLMGHGSCCTDTKRTRSAPLRLGDPTF